MGSATARIRKKRVKETDPKKPDDEMLCTPE